MTTYFQFPPTEEQEHRFNRTSAYLIAMLVAILPFCINLLWRWFDGGNSAGDILDHGIVDLAFAGVVVAVSTFTNTYFSVRLFGWHSVSRETFLALLAVTVSALFSFVAYLQSTHVEIPDNLKAEVFMATFLLVMSSFVFSYVAHYCFLEDEFRAARERLKHLPALDRVDIEI